MKDFLFTFKFLLKQNLSFKHSFHRLKTDKRYRNMFVGISIVLLVCLPSYAIFIGLFADLFKTFQQMYMSSYFLVMAILMSVILIVFFGMFQIMGFFYFSSDVKIMTPLPLKQNCYLISKFLIIYIWELILSVFVILPFFIIYGIYEELAFYNWISMIFTFILLPIVPLVIVGILTVFIMKFSNLFKSKDAMRLTAYLLLIIGLVYFQYKFYELMFSMPEDPNAQFQFWENIINNSSYFLEKFSLFYPISKFVIYAVSGNFFDSIFSVIVFIMVAIGFIYLFGLILKSMFLDSYLSEQNNNNTKKRKIKKVSENLKGNGSTILAITKIDILTLLKVPIYLLNTLSLVILIPLILLIYTSLMPRSSDSQQIVLMLNYYNSNRGVFWLGVSLFFGVFAALNPIASTTFSREGKTNWIMRTLPISAKDNVLGRFLTGFLTEFWFGIIMTGIILYLLFQRGNNISLDFIYGIISLILGLISASTLMFIGIFIDLKRPMLKWENPQQPVKQNMNVLISIAVALIYGTIMVLLYKLLSLFMIEILLYIVFFVINIVLAYIAYNVLVKQFDESLILMD